ncbi:MAG: host-nuclease inhibitor Gam family protein [Bryobacteraceae bacterium]
MIRNWNEFDRKLKEIALLDLSCAEHARVRDLAVIAATTQYDSETKPLLKIRDNITADLEEFYRTHRKEAETGGKKSIELNFGRAGIRLGNPTLALAKGMTWGQVIGKIKARIAQWEPFIRSKEEVNKEALKAKPAEELAALGLRIKQGEEFWFETFPDKAVDAAA